MQNEDKNNTRLRGRNRNEKDTERNATVKVKEKKMREEIGKKRAERKVASAIKTIVCI